MLAESGDGVVAEDGGVEGVAAQVRVGGRVRLLSEVLDLPRGDGDGAHLGQIDVRRVDHHRRVDSLEGPGLGHEDLAAASLLTRRAHDHDPSAGGVGEGGGGQAGPEPGGGDDVVAAAVPDAGQGVVLAEHGDRRPLAAGASCEGGLQTEGAALHVEAGVGEGSAEDVGREALLEQQLGPVVDAMGRLDEVVGPAVDLFDQPLLGGSQVHMRTLGPLR